MSRPSTRHHFATSHRLFTAGRALALGTLALLAPSCSGGSPTEDPAAALPLQIAPVPDAPVMLGVTPAVRAAGRTGTVVAVLDDRGVPQLLLSAAPQPAPPGVTAAVAARHHLARHAPSLGIEGTALDQAVLLSTGRAGATAVIARFQQRFEDIEVHRAGVRLLMNDDLSLAAVAGRLVSGNAQRTRAAAAFRLPASEALAASIAELFELAVAPTPLVEAEPEPDYTRFTLSVNDPIALGEPARAKKVWFVEPAADGRDRLVAAWFVELYAARPGEPMRAFRFVLDAADARVLERQDLTLADSFNFRVFADAAGDKRPLDSPLQDMTPHPTAMPNAFKPGNVAPNLVSMEGFNKNPNGAADPWLPPGAMATQGNNVDAYADRATPDGLSANNDFRASVTMPGVFDRTYDLNASPTVSVDQGMAAVTNLFYLTNWLHDYFYDSGFDEEAGNAQNDNYGRGGRERDSMRAEAQDNVLGGSRDNANMSTPADGMRPRMQVFVWNAGGQETRLLTVTPPGQNLANDGADFGPDSYDLTAQVVLAADGANPVTDACTALVNGAALMGKIALIDRGTCSFQTKAANAQAAGAVGVIIADNQQSNNPPHLGSGNGPTPTIPAMGIRLTDGNSIKAALMMGTVTARLNRVRGALADASLDNTVTAHEWGHYLHHRLTQCNLNQCAAMSEGWGDLMALHLSLREGDNLDGVYPMAPYAARRNDSYFGLRRMPYSVDMTKNGLTFKHISNGQALPSVPRRGGGPNAEVHNAGEVWTTMMWEVYVAMHKADRAKGVPFADTRRRFADYVVAGLQLAPTDATYLEQRDAILAAAAQRNKEDVALIAAAFARRGAGSCAKGPARESTGFSGVVESFEVKGRVDIREVTIDDSVRSCDKDGQLDAEETGKVTVKLGNGGLVPLTGIKVTVSSTSPGVTFPGGGTATVPDIAALETGTITILVALDSSLVKMSSLDLDVRVDAANTCDAGLTQKVSWRVNYDEQPMSTATDEVESEKAVAWMATGDLSDRIWSRTETGVLKHAWHGVDWGSPSDTSLISPDLQVGTTDSFIMQFDHKYMYEEGDERGAHHFYDGALLEISDDEGQSWRDSLGWLNPGYRGAITDISGNALADRQAFVGTSPRWPDYDHATLDFGKAFAGKTIRMRFRISTDQAAGNYGWEIDNIAFGGITNKPFSTLVDDMTTCKQSLPLVANAGPDQGTASGVTVLLDASASSGGNGNPLSFRWTQTAGPTVALSDPMQPKPTFQAPPVTSVVRLTFSAAVTDGEHNASDTVDVLVGAALSEGCCNITASATRGVDPTAALALLAIVLLPLRRRAARRRN